MELLECSNCGAIINVDADNYSWVESDGYCGVDNILCEGCTE